MPADLSPSPPRTVDGILELIARPIFAAGMAWSTMEGVWPATREAFARFSVRSVAGYGERDVARLLATPGVIANERKVRAVIEAARALASHGRRHGSARRWLDALADHDARVAALRALPGVGPWGAHYVLAKMDYPVPPWP